MNEPETEYLRKQLDELRNQIRERDHENAKETGYSKGWREATEHRLDRMERQIDSLLFSLIDGRPRKARDDRRPEPNA